VIERSRGDRAFPGDRACRDQSPAGRRKTGRLGDRLGGMGTNPPVCDFCGTAAPTDPATGAGADGLPLTWTTAVENGRSRVFCTACSREHLRAIEGKLDSEWW
jgi:hypothetical protein